MKKKIQFIAFILLIVLSVSSCSSIASIAGLDGLAGFDSQSRKELEEGFIEIEWLSGDEELFDTVSSLCKSGSFSVSYSDRLRMLEFVAINSPIRLDVYNDRIEFVYTDTLSRISDYGWYAPRGITLLCYGRTYSENFRNGEVERTDRKAYIKLIGQYVEYRYEDVTHKLSEEACTFLTQNWSNNDLYVTVYGRMDKNYRIKNNDLVNLYRVFYEALFPYDFISGAAESAIVDFLDSLTTVNSSQAAAINNYLNQNPDLTNEEVKSLSNLVNSKIRY